MCVCEPTRHVAYVDLLSDLGKSMAREPAKVDGSAPRDVMREAHTYIHVLTYTFDTSTFAIRL